MSKFRTPDPEIVNELTKIINSEVGWKTKTTTFLNSALGKYTAPYRTDI